MALWRGQPRGKRSSSHPNKQAEIGVSKHALRCEFLLSFKNKALECETFLARSLREKKRFFSAAAARRTAA